MLREQKQRPKYIHVETMYCFTVAVNVEGVGVEKNYRAETTGALRGGTLEARRGRIL